MLIITEQHKGEKKFKRMETRNGKSEVEKGGGGRGERGRGGGRGGGGGGGGGHDGSSHQS